MPQGFGAVAAFERDNRAAVSGRVPHRLPGGRGNRPARGVQARGAGFHTSRTGGLPLPPRSGAGCTCYLKPSRAGSHVTAAPARAVQCPDVQGDGGGIDSLPRKHRAAMISLPLRTGGERASRAAQDTGRGVRTGADTSAAGGADGRAGRGAATRDADAERAATSAGRSAFVRPTRRMLGRVSGSSAWRCSPDGKRTASASERVPPMD